MKKVSVLINRTATKRYILDKLKSKRPFLGLTRVSKEALDIYEARLRDMIIRDIDIHPAVGKTFKL